MEFAKQTLADSLSRIENELQMQMAHQEELDRKNRVNIIFLILGLFVLFIAIWLLSRVYFTRKANARLQIEKDRAGMN